MPPDNAGPFVAPVRHERLQCGDAVGSDGGVVARSCEVGAGRPDNVIGGGRVCAAADEPCCEHDDRTNAKTGSSNGQDWVAARRFMSAEFYLMATSERRQLEPDCQCVFHTAAELSRFMRMGDQ